jgi:hypothetical protein
LLPLPAPATRAAAGTSSLLLCPTPALTIAVLLLQEIGAKLLSAALAKSTFVKVKGCYKLSGRPAKKKPHAAAMEWKDRWGAHVNDIKQWHQRRKGFFGPRSMLANLERGGLLTPCNSTETKQVLSSRKKRLLAMKEKFETELNQTHNALACGNLRHWISEYKCAIKDCDAVLAAALAKLSAAKPAAKKAKKRSRAEGISGRAPRMTLMTPRMTPRMSCAGPVRRMQPPQRPLTPAEKATFIRRTVHVPQSEWPNEEPPHGQHYWVGIVRAAVKGVSGCTLFNVHLEDGDVYSWPIGSIKAWLQPHDTTALASNVTSSPSVPTEAVAARSATGHASGSGIRKRTHARHSTGAEVRSPINQDELLARQLQRQLLGLRKRSRHIS